jgi:signal transduction histidine kinase
MQILMARRAAEDSELPVMRDIVARIDSLSELINDLMVFARPRPLRLGEVALRSLVEDAVTMARRDPIGEQVAITVEGPEVEAQADAEMIRATVLNLLINAAQAMNGHGRIDVTLGRSGNTSVIVVRDYGPGIPADLRDRVLEPFFTTKARGGGLGLPIARRTAELHGGTLTIESPAGEGTAVTLRLPLRPAVTTTDAPDAAVPTRTSRFDTAPDRG